MTALVITHVEMLEVISIGFETSHGEIYLQCIIKSQTRDDFTLQNQN
jgi:uncharacterized Fe-S cluster-containing MiaB family protein